MASTYPMPPAVAALFARRIVVPVKPVEKQAVISRPAAVIAGPPRRNLRRGSLLDLLV